MAEDDGPWIIIRRFRHPEVVRYLRYDGVGHSRKRWSFDAADAKEFPTQHAANLVCQREGGHAIRKSDS